MIDMSTGSELCQSLLRTHGGYESELLPGQRAEPLGTPLCKMRTVKMERRGVHKTVYGTLKCAFQRADCVFLYRGLD